MEFSEFENILSANEIILNLEQIKIFKHYHKELLYWNDKINLISRQDENNILEKHFIHSLAVFKYVDIPQKAKCLDIGTGGGFPGLPIKIVRPDIYMLLSDSIKKKIMTTEIFVKSTKLHNINCILGRTENLCNYKKYLNYFDIITSRAVAKITKLLDWSFPLIKNNGKFVFLKGGNLDEEINQAKEKYNKFIIEVKEINILGCNLLNTGEKKLVIIYK